MPCLQNYPSYVFIQENEETVGNKDENDSLMKIEQVNKNDLSYVVN